MVVVGVDFAPMTTRCPSCGADATGKFCSSCGAPLAGALCSNCRAPLTPGAKFCHRCGAPAGVNAAASASPSGVGNALPWAVAGIALLALIALAAGQRFGRPREEPQPVDAPFAAPGAAPGRAPDISSMSPAERAERLYDRIMSAAERGKVDSVRFFLPMAMQAYAAIGDLSVDQHYDVGRLAEVGGEQAVVAAHADSILAKQPTHLLGLLLASRAAGLRNDRAGAQRYLERLARASSAEMRKALPEYELHRNDIESAMAEYRRAGGK